MKIRTILILLGILSCLNSCQKQTLIKGKTVSSEVNYIQQLYNVEEHNVLLADRESYLNRSEVWTSFFTREGEKKAKVDNPSSRWENFLKLFVQSGCKNHDGLVPVPSGLEFNRAEITDGSNFDGQSFLLITPDKKLATIYFQGECNETTIKELLPDAMYRTRWFNPRNGKWDNVECGIIQANEMGEIVISHFPGDKTTISSRKNEDWAMKLLYTEEYPLNNGTDESFMSKVGVAQKSSGMQRDGYKVWGSSVIKGEDGKYHMFASSWSYLHPRSQWYSHSEIIHGVCDNPEGPFKYRAVVLPARGEGYWDGAMTHNPCIQKHKDTYILFYTGTNYIDSTDLENHRQAWGNKRLGIATSKSVYGPWTRYDKPIIEPREGEWDNLITSNAAPCVREDGSVLLVYKSTAHLPTTPCKNQIYDLKLGVAKADHYLGEYKRIRNDWLFSEMGLQFDFEDGYCWYQNGEYNLLCKLFSHGIYIMGEDFAGIHATSKDGIYWKMKNPAQAYSRTVNWTDGTSTKYRRLERVQLLIEDGKPTHVYFAASSDDPIANPSRSICIPLK